MPEFVERPQDWDKVIAVAWCFVLGGRTKAAADATGVSQSTIRNWLASSWWPDAYEEARGMVPVHFASKALLALDAGLDRGDQHTARYIADRLVPEMAPPTVRQEVDMGGTVTATDIAEARRKVEKALALKKKA